MDKYLTRLPQPTRANSPAKRGQLAPTSQLPPTMSPPRRKSLEIPESPQGSPETELALGEDGANRSRRVVAQSQTASRKRKATTDEPSGSIFEGAAETTEVPTQRQSDITRQLIRYTGSEAHRQVQFTRGQMQKAPVLNPYLLEMEKLRDHRPARGELPFDWQRARAKGDDMTQPAFAQSHIGGKLPHVPVSSIVEGVRSAKISTTAPKNTAGSALLGDAKASKSKKQRDLEIMEHTNIREGVQRLSREVRPQIRSGSSRAQYRELEELVPAADAPIFSSAVAQQTSSRNSGYKSHPRKTRPTWNPEKMATGPRSREAETASILVGMQFTPAINEAMPYGELKYRLESHSPDTREGLSRKKRRVEAAKETEKVVIDLTMDD
ncbi:hypothetical protein CKM354_001014800 [Cercospora kikuchii]|uniref:Uncharacterized protein n=1 Tax=Cercospora kikuchii TaxID=84275 RepID=A0A9P3CT13_9PEZI|nr:uncharacterized protein CKM354_001014800 [Cercospora kikuchii]GIZ47047.1 hypothetical protein CKM354_001014800 [Cercospora kikuchii]